MLNVTLFLCIIIVLVLLFVVGCVVCRVLFVIWELLWFDVVVVEIGRAHV